MSLNLTIIGGGVTGAITAMKAVDAGYSVLIIEAQNEKCSPSSLSWGDSRMIRDERRGSGDNIPAWRSILERIGCPIASKGIRHSWGRQSPIGTNSSLRDAQVRKHGIAVARVEMDAFVVDAPIVRQELYHHLRATGQFRLEEGRVAEVNPVNGSYLKEDSDWVESEATVICAGAASTALLGLTPSFGVRQVQQVSAIIKKSAVYGCPEAFPAFIHHRQRGAWGTPATRNLPAKISSPRLCFADGMAKAFVASVDEQLRFIQSMRHLLPGLQITDIERWSVGGYAEKSSEAVSQIGRVPAALACNGSGFKRAPLTASKLLSKLQRDSI